MRDAQVQYMGKLVRGVSKMWCCGDVAIFAGRFLIGTALRCGHRPILLMVLRIGSRDPYGLYSKTLIESFC
jgi:hypothetical protein